MLFRLPFIHLFFKHRNYHHWILPNAYKPVPMITADNVSIAFNEMHNNAAQHFGLFSLLQSMLGELYRNYQAPTIDNETEAWSHLEQMLRRQQLFRPSLKQCVDISGLSSATLNRYCRSLHACSPLKRMQFIRMQHARSLLRLSTMSISQIADYLGYPRLHEFSRECKQQLGASPRQLRQQMLIKPDMPLGAQ